MGKRQETRAESVNLEQVLKERHYAVDYYQRDYAWGSREVRELVDDLTNKFKSFYKPHHDPESIDQDYGQYFLGPFTVNEQYLQEEGHQVEYILDGQQRLTTLTLLFLYLHHFATEHKLVLYKVEDYIHSRRRTKASFNIEVPERRRTMEWLHREGRSPITSAPLDVQHDQLAINYGILAERMRQQLRSTAEVEVFYHWLVERVWMVKVQATNDVDAYEIFESMNDRGKPLTELDKLKGYLLSRIPYERRGFSSLQWRDMMKNLDDDKEVAESFIKDLFRARWARDTAQDSGELSDWITIQRHFYRWLKENHERPDIELVSPKEVEDFVSILPYYSGLYKKLMKYGTQIVGGYEEVTHLHLSKIPHWQVLFLGLISPHDSSEESKIKAIAKYQITYAALQAWNGTDHLNEANLAARVVRLMKNVRANNQPELLDLQIVALAKSLKALGRTFEITSRTLETGGGKKRSRAFLILSVLTSWIEAKVTRNDPFVSYIEQGYEVEHLLAADFEKNNSWYSDAEALLEVRNKIGALGILEKGVNSSYKDMPYREKVEKYIEQNRLLSTLNSDIYVSDLSRKDKFANNRPLNRLLEEFPQLQGLWRPEPELNPEAIYRRTKLISELCKIIWNPDDLLDFLETFDDVSSFEDLYVLLDGELAEEDSQIDGKKAPSRFLDIGDVLVYRTTTRDGVVKSVKARSVGGSKVVILEMSNAPHPEKWSKSMEGSKSYYQTYEVLKKDAVPTSHGYTWLGESDPVPSTQPLSLLVGSPVGNHLWTVVKMADN